MSDRVDGTTMDFKLVLVPVTDVDRLGPAAGPVGRRGTAQCWWGTGVVVGPANEIVGTQPSC